jgi:hypothetical protein
MGVQNLSKDACRGAVKTGQLVAVKTGKVSAKALRASPAMRVVAC